MKFSAINEENRLMVSKVQFVCSTLLNIADLSAVGVARPGASLRRGYRVEWRVSRKRCFHGRFQSLGGRVRGVSQSAATSVHVKGRAHAYHVHVKWDVLFRCVETYVQSPTLVLHRFYTGSTLVLLVLLCSYTGSTPVLLWFYSAPTPVPLGVLTLLPEPSASYPRVRPRQHVVKRGTALYIIAAGLDVAADWLKPVTRSWPRFKETGYLTRKSSQNVPPVSDRRWRLFINLT